MSLQCFATQHHCELFTPEESCAVATICFTDVQAAFKRKRRSMLAADVIDELGGVVDGLSEPH